MEKLIILFNLKTTVEPCKKIFIHLITNIKFFELRDKKNHYIILANKVNISSFLYTRPPDGGLVTQIYPWKVRGEIFFSLKLKQVVTVQYSSIYILSVYFFICMYIFFSFFKKNSLHV